MVTRRRAGAVLSCALVLMPVAQAQAGGSKGKVVAVDAAFHDPGVSGFSNYGVEGCPAGSAPCSLAWDGQVTWTGSLLGVSEYHARLTPGEPNEAFQVEVWETFTGTVTGCGDGSLRWYGKGYADPLSFDATTQTFPLHVPLTIVTDSGTGQLRKISGGGLVEARVRLVAPAEQDGQHLGNVRC